MKKRIIILIILSVALLLVVLFYLSSDTSLTGYFSFGDLLGAPGKSGGGKTATPQCQDHIDNDKDGYCDYPYPNAYCNDGSRLGDPECTSKSGTNEFCQPKTEICDGKDNNCNSQIDENVCNYNYYCDNDKDGAYSINSSGTCNTYGCVPAGCSQYIGNDCNDNNPAISPKAIDNCGNDSIDNDCDGMVDECCSELFPGTNVMNSDRVNVVFIGMLYTDKNLFLSQAKSSVDYYSNLVTSGPGLMELPVYKNNKNKFNFWYVDSIATPSYMPISSCTQCSNYKAQSVCSGMPNTYYINFCYTSFRGCAYFGGNSYIATAGAYAGSWPYVVDHEFQHQFPTLYDEYTETGLGDRPGAPNCAQDTATAKNWWGMYENQSSSDGQKVGYYDGCSYTAGNYRPTTNSMMRSWVFNLGLVNEKDIEKDLLRFTGAPSTLQNAVELTLTGKSEDITTYELTEIKPAFALSNENKNKDLPYKVKLKTPDKEYAGEFDIYDYLVVEDFNSKDKKISLVSFEKTLKKVIKIKLLTDSSLQDLSLKGMEISIEDKDSKLLKKLK